MTTDAAPGWDAIERALLPIYGGQEPKHYGTIIKHALGGPDPLDGISAYKRTDDRCHWHIVSYGLTELYAKESDDPEVSGCGFELTFRLSCSPSDEGPPIWALNFLQNLARYVFQTGNVFGQGDHMTLNGPIALDEGTEITAVLFVNDPELPATESPHGRFGFLQVVGITEDELAAAQAWNSAGFSEVLRTTSALLITDLKRKTILADAHAAREIADRTERDGSSTGELYVSTVSWQRSGLISKRARVTIDALAASGLVTQLRGRLLHRRPLLLIGRGDSAQNVVAFHPAEQPAVTTGETGCLSVSLPDHVTRAMSEALKPERGVYEWKALPGFEIEVVPTQIRDRDGKVVRVVG